MLDPQEEIKFLELKKYCKDLKVAPPTDVFIGLQVHQNDKMIFDDIQRGHSWTRNYWNYIYAVCSGSGLDDVGSFGAGQLNTSRTDGQGLQSIVTMRGAISYGGLGSNYGIVVGSGDAAFSVEHLDLDELIISGTGTGQLTSSAGGYLSQSYEAKQWTVLHRRIFNNNSGGDIVVRETGLYDGGWPPGVLCLLERSVLDPTVTVPNGAQLTVTYTIVDDFSGVD